MIVREARGQAWAIDQTLISFPRYPLKTFPEKGTFPMILLTASYSDQHPSNDSCKFPANFPPKIAGCSFQSTFFLTENVLKLSLLTQTKEIKSHHPLPNPPPWETLSQRHCEGVERPKQSHKNLKLMRLARSLRSLAMTNRDYDTASWGGGEGGGNIN